MRDSEDSKTDELLTMLEELQDENESLQRQISEAQWTISQLSSANSELKKELQRKSNTIVSLNEKIEMWSVSDLVHQQNEELAKQNRELQLDMQRIKEEASATVSAVKREYTEKKEELERKNCYVIFREQQARDWKDNYLRKVEEEAMRITETARLSAEQEYRQKVEKAEKKYKQKCEAVYGVTFGSLLYGFFATILTACNSTRLMKDFWAFASALWKLLSGPFLLSVDICRIIWTVKELISYPYLNMLVAIILMILIFALLNALAYGAIGFLVCKTIRFYHQKFGDLISGIAALISMGLFVWFADKMTWVKWNLVFVWLLTHGTFLLIRVAVSCCWGNRDISA